MAAASPNPRPEQPSRNIGIIAHIDAGKTTTTDHVLYLSPVPSIALGSVDARAPRRPDYNEEEQERGITIYKPPACRSI